MASLVGAILFLLPITLPISHFPFSTPIFHSHFPLPFPTFIYHSHFPLPFPTPISHFHFPLSFPTPQVATLWLLPSACYPLPVILWLRVCTPSGQCHSCTRFLSCQQPLPDGAPLQCPGQQQLRHSATANSTFATAPPASNKSHRRPRPATNLIWRREVLRFG